MIRRARPAVRWTVYVAVAIAFAVVCAFLSHWQFSRNAWRTEQLELVSVNYDAAPVPLEDALPAGQPFPAWAEWKPVLLEGEYLAEQQVLVRNRAHGGTAAYEVLVPFRLDDGRILVVNRGWVMPSPERNAEPEAVPAPPRGEATVVVRLRPGEQLPGSGRSAPPGQVPTIHLPLIAESLGDQGSSVQRDAYGILVSEDPAPASVPNTIDPPSIDPGPYLSYAIQWILFAIMGFIFIGYVIRTEIKARLEDADDEDAGHERPRRPRRRRRDADAADEDALVEALR